jgi:hypothetical protein
MGNFFELPILLAHLVEQVDALMASWPTTRSIPHLRPEEHPKGGSLHEDCILPRAAAQDP